MKRFLICLAFVLVFLGATVAYAEDVNMIGKRVDATYPVFINGQELEKNAIAIDGVSYLPVRVAADEFGFNTNFVNKMVVLSPKLATSPPLSVKVHFNTLDTKVDPEKKFNARYLGGEWYLESGAFGAYASFDGKQATVSIPECNTLTVQVYQYYEPGVDGFWDGVTYIKASALGLQASLYEGTLDLDS